VGSTGTASFATETSIVPIPGGSSIGRDLSHGADQQPGVPSPGVIAYRSALIGRICSRLACAERESRNRAIASATTPLRAEPRHVGLEARLIELHELAAIERIDAALELRA
jgi:hypothetical protein